MKKIIFVISSMSGGGAERVISILATAFSRKYEVGIMTIFFDECVYPLPDSVKMISLNLNGLNGIKRNVERVKQIREILKQEDPDVVISFLPSVSIFTVLSSLFTNVPLIISERNDPKHEPTSKFLRLFRTFLYLIRKKNYFVFQTMYAEHCFPGIIRRKSRIIYNPLKPDLPYANLDKPKNEIVCISRLEREKNISMLLQAFAKIHTDYPNFTLHLYGKGPLEAQLKEEATKLGISNDVIFHGFQKNVHSCIKEAFCFVLPSDFEGISNAMLEALAMGIPTIVTDCPAYGAKEFISNGENGFIITPGDVVALEKKIRKILSDTQLRQSFGKKSVLIRDKLEESKIVSDWEEFCNEITQD